MAQQRDGAADLAARGAPNAAPPISHPNLHDQSAHYHQELDLSQDHEMRRMSQSYTLTPSRGGTLKKRQSLSRKNSVKQSGSRKGSRAGSVRSLAFADDVIGSHDSEMHSAFFTPVPTTGSPTEILANRFQGRLHQGAEICSGAKDLANMLDSSLAQSTQRPDHILSRHSEVLRFPFQIPIHYLECPYQYPNTAPTRVRGWHKRCHAYPTRLP